METPRQPHQEEEEEPASKIVVASFLHYFNGIQFPLHVNQTLALVISLSNPSLVSCSPLLWAFTSLLHELHKTLTQRNAEEGEVVSEEESESDDEDNLAHRIATTISNALSHRSAVPIPASPNAFFLFFQEVVILTYIVQLSHGYIMEPIFPSYATTIINTPEQVNAPSLVTTLMIISIITQSWLFHRIRSEATSIVKNTELVHANTLPLDVVKECLSARTPRNASSKTAKKKKQALWSIHFKYFIVVCCIPVFILSLFGSANLIGLFYITALYGVMLLVADELPAWISITVLGFTEFVITTDYIWQLFELNGETTIESAIGLRPLTLLGQTSDSLYITLILILLVCTVVQCYLMDLSITIPEITQREVTESENYEFVKTGYATIKRFLKLTPVWIALLIFTSAAVSMDTSIFEGLKLIILFSIHFGFSSYNTYHGKRLKWMIFALIIAILSLANYIFQIFEIFFQEEIDQNRLLFFIIGFRSYNNLYLGYMYDFMEIFLCVAFRFTFKSIKRGITGRSVTMAQKDLRVPTLRQAGRAKSNPYQLKVDLAASFPELPKFV